MTSQSFEAVVDYGTYLESYLAQGAAPQTAKLSSLVTAMPAPTCMWSWFSLRSIATTRCSRRSGASLNGMSACRVRSLQH